LQKKITTKRLFLIIFFVVYAFDEKKGLLFVFGSISEQSSPTFLWSENTNRKEVLSIIQKHGADPILRCTAKGLPPWPMWPRRSWREKEGVFSAREYNTPSSLYAQ